LEKISRSSDAETEPEHQEQLAENPRKRKSPFDDGPKSRASSNGMLTPNDGANWPHSRTRVIDLESTCEPDEDFGPRIYNGYLEKKEGRLVAKRAEGPAVASINTRKLPTTRMEEIATRASVSQAQRAIRQAFEAKLRQVRGVRLENKYDESTPSLDFEFVKEYVLRDGVSGEPPNTYQGCQKCLPDMGGAVGCEYTAKCDCLEFAAVDENSLARKDPEAYAVYLIAKEQGGGIDTAGLPKRFPYLKPKLNGEQTLVPFYQGERHPIYECNVNCRCGPRCKTRLVQKGRKVPLVIFRTRDRGWGVKCDQDLVPGQFIDTYLGEVITSAEADRREEEGSIQAKASYLYALDKFVGDDLPGTDSELQAENCYVVDGQHIGNITRFINHSCEPNCRQYTVSYNKHDLKLYNLAFFANDFIPKGTELTFDYSDKDEEELEAAVQRREAALADPANQDRPRCHCGAEKCRGFLWG
jgi:histone-lysine N-methyltransferase SUV39H